MCRYSAGSLFVSQIFWDILVIFSLDNRCKFSFCADCNSFQNPSSDTNITMERTVWVGAGILWGIYVDSNVPHFLHQLCYPLFWSSDYCRAIHFSSLCI